MLAGDAMVAIALAGSLFFDISPHAAAPHVLLGLTLTFVPFVVIAPAIGPLLDSIAGMRKGLVLVSALGRVALCILMAGDLKSLLLFPESFGLLVLSKVYGVSRQSLVPEVVGEGVGGEERFVHANATLNFHGAVAGFVGSAIAVAVWKTPGLGSPWVLRTDAVVFAVAALYALRLPRAGARPERAGLGRPGLASGGGEDWTPVIRGSSERAGAGRTSGEVATDPFGTVPVAPPPPIGPPQGAGGEIGTEELGAEVSVSHRGLRNKIVKQKMAGLFAAASAMAVLRAEVGFLEFLLIFTLRRQHYALIWFGIVLTGLTAGSVLANALAPRVRTRLPEEKTVAAALAVVCVMSALAGWSGGMLLQALLMCVTGFSTGVAKVSFDALVQRDTPTRRRGTAFARFETRFQLVWVMGAVIPVAFTFPVRWGDAAMAVAASVATVAYLSRWRAVTRRARR